jgi:hypothetical protein
MNTYEITIRATITKTYTVEAKNSDEAIELANELFSVLEDGAPENYEQETLDIEETSATDETRSNGPHQ